MQTSIRKCSSCSDNSLHLKKSSLSILGFQETFVCSSCQFKIKITPKGGQGYYFSLFLMFMSIVYFLFLGGGEGRIFDTWDFITLIIVFFLGVFPFYRDYGINSENPIVGSEDIPSNAPKQGLVVRLLSKGNFIVGFLVPLVFIALFLGFFTLLGMINFYFFDDKLLG